MDEGSYKHRGIDTRGCGLANAARDSTDLLGMLAVRARNDLSIHVLGPQLQRGRQRLARSEKRRPCHITALDRARLFDLLLGLASSNSLGVTTSFDSEEASDLVLKSTYYALGHMNLAM